MTDVSDSPPGCLLSWEAGYPSDSLARFDRPTRGGRIHAPCFQDARAEAGRKGGLTTKQRYGREFFERIGRIGGKKGGDTTKKRYGVEFYQNIGRKGGSK